MAYLQMPQSVNVTASGASVGHQCCLGKLWGLDSDQIITKDKTEANTQILDARHRFLGA